MSTARSAAAYALAAALLLGGCMSDAGINDPLPRMSQAKAGRWAENWINSMARTTGAEIDPARTESEVVRCRGANDEVPTDGRYYVVHSTKARLQKDRHADAIRKLRRTLEAKGFAIDGYRAVDHPTIKDGMDYRSAMDATHPTDRQHITVDSISDSLLSLEIYTPCLLPPGVEQQQF